MSERRWMRHDAFLAAAVAWVRAALSGSDRAEAFARMDDEREWSAFAGIADAFNLSPFEQQVLLLCIAFELDTSIGALCASPYPRIGAQAEDQRPAGYDGKPFPTFALALNVFDDPHWDALSPEGPLRRWHLIALHPIAGQPLVSAALQIDPRVLNAAKGLDDLDERLAVIARPVLEEDPPLAGSHIQTLDQIAQVVGAAGSMPVIQLAGADSDGKRAIAAHLARMMDASLHSVAMAALPSHPADVAMLARLWNRECALSRRVLLIDAREAMHALSAGESDGQGEAGMGSLRRFLADLHGLTLVDVRDPLRKLDAETAVFDISMPAMSEQREAWRAALDEAGATQLASQFNFSLSAIGRIVKTARDAGDAWRLSLRRSRPQLDQLAQRIDVKATWNDIVLPAAQIDLLRQIATHVQHRSRVYGDWGFAGKLNRGLGITALFAGDSGTGKTMAAEVLASNLQLNLYRIDLSAVVSKYIGETEKNLRRLFDAAEDGGSILLFDEADALFGKRSEVKDSHDRYANIEVNYLLQRMEAFRGLAILATNMKSALDAAFMRRLRFVVQFPYPSVVERRLIWQKAFPHALPLDALDYERLARFNLSGGNIQSIALNAAFLAAQNGGVVSMAHVLAATRTEYVKLERGVNEREFEA